MVTVILPCAVAPSLCLVGGPAAHRSRSASPVGRPTLGVGPVGAFAGVAPVVGEPAGVLVPVHDLREHQPPR